MDDDEALSRLNLPDPGMALLVDVITCIDVDPQIRDYAIDHPSISDTELLAFMQSASEGVLGRCLVATSRTAVLRYYMLEGNVDQRASVAFNNASDRGIIMLALSDPEERVRCQAMFCPALPDAQVAWHRDHDPSPAVRDAAKVALEDEMGRYVRSGGTYLLDNGDGTYSTDPEWLEE